jgi:hypothetical protein
MSHRLLAGAATLALLAAPAVAAAEVHRYQTVDAIETAHVYIPYGQNLVIAISGTLDTGAQHTAYYVGFLDEGATSESAALEGCQRMALMALAKPGRFRLEVVDETTRDTGYTRLVRCKLVRND